jgi:hypothetical protein
MSVQFQPRASLKSIAYVKKYQEKLFQRCFDNLVKVE